MTQQVTHQEILDSYFPEVPHGIVPVGNNVLVQTKFIPSKSTGGIFIMEETRETEKYNCQIGKVIAMGDLAFKDRKTLEDWPEGKWVDIGEVVFIPRTGHRMTKGIEGETYSFVLLQDTEILTKLNDLSGFSQFL